MIVHITRATRLLLFWSLIAAALLLSATRILLATAADYRPQLEQKIRQLTELPLHIGQLDAGMRGFNPEIILRDIRIDDQISVNPPDIQLREIRLGIDFLDLLLSQNWLAACRLTLVGASISATRNLDGSLSVKGIQASDEPPLWLLQGGKFEFLDSQVSWQDLQRHREPLQFDRLDLVLKNHVFDDRHELHLLSRLPEKFGDKLRLSALFSGNPFEGGNLAGQLYIEGEDLQAEALLPGELPLELNLQKGAGDIRLWSQWQDGKPFQVDGYIQAQQIKLGKNDGKTAALDTLAASFSWSDASGRWRLAGYDIDIFANRQHWPDGAFYLQQDAEGNLSAVVKQLDLPAAMLLAPLLLPTENDYSDWLKLNPKGRLHDVMLFANPDFSRYAGHGHFEGLGNERWESVPKLQNFSGSFSLTHEYGQLMLETNQASLEAPDWFRNPLDIPRLHGRLHWWQDADGWQFFGTDLQLDSADFASASHLNLWLPKTDTAPVIDLRTAFGDFNDISQVPKYLPAKLMNPDAVAWLDDAFVSGQIRQGETVVQGALDRFPFADGVGRFETIFAIENGEIQFNEQWPHLHDIYADVQFSGPDLQVAIEDGGSEKAGIKQALITIPQLADSERLYVWGQVDAGFAEALDLLLKSPLKPKVEPLTSVLAGAGSVRVDLDLNIPYEESVPVNVKVDAHLNGNRLNVKPVDLQIDAVKGVLNFTEDSVASGPLEAKTLGHPLRGRLSSDQHATYLDFDGSTSVANLIKQFDFLKNQAASGRFDYRGRLTMPYLADETDTLTIDSTLQGMNVDGPGPLRKPADTQRPAQLAFRFEDGNLLPLQIRYGEALQAFLLIDKARENLYSGHILLGTGQSQRYDFPGLKLEVRQAEFDLSQALAAFQDDSADNRPAAREFWLDTEQLLWQKQALGPMHCRFQRGEQLWQGYLDSPLAKGHIRLPDQRGGNNRIDLQMAYLNLSEIGKLNLSGANEIVTELPLIDINSQQLIWRTLNLGELQLQTERLPNGIHFKQIRLLSPHNRIDLSADWLKQPTGTQTQIKGKLHSDRFGQLLSQLAFTEDFKETTTDIAFKGGWRGGPHQFSFEHLNGQLQVELKDGRISSIEPGFGRLLGLLAMEQWVKRLSLDFSDIYREGLAFDAIKGHFKIKDGVAFTDDLVVDAVAADFYLAGSVNLADKSLQQRVAVVPKSSDAVPIAGTIVGGIAAIITQAVTGEYKEGYFFGSQYQLSGTLGDVEVTPLHSEDGLLQKTWRGLTDFDWLNSVND